MADKEAPAAEALPKTAPDAKAPLAITIEYW